MKVIAILTYFHRKIGPLVFYSYPEGAIDGSTEAQVGNLMDQMTADNLFVHSAKNFRSINYYFEIHSKWGRGNKEMLLASIFLGDEKYPEEIERGLKDLCTEFSDRMKGEEEIFHGFYIDGIGEFDDKIVKKIAGNHELIRLLVKDFYWDALEIARGRTEEEKIAALLGDRRVFSMLNKLSRGPVSLEKLRDWFCESFQEDDFDDLLSSLAKNEFIFVNKFGSVEEFVILVKEVKASRIPPVNLVDYVDRAPELVDPLLEVIQRYFSAYEKMTNEELKEDALVLFEVISRPKTYQVLSELRSGFIRTDKLPKMVSERSLEDIKRELEYLKGVDLAEDLNINRFSYCALKADVQITTSFPSYLGSLLIDRVEPLVANSHIKEKLNIVEILEDVRAKGERRLQKQKRDKMRNIELLLRGLDKR